MQNTYEHSFNWSFVLKANPAQLWPYISDTNKFLKSAGQFSVRKESFLREKKKGFLELTSTKINTGYAWVEEPYAWEKPFRFGTSRKYKASLIQSLSFMVNLIPYRSGTRLNIDLKITTSRKFIKYFLSQYIERFVKRKVQKYVSDCDQSAFTKTLPYEHSKKVRLTRRAKTKISEIEEKLLENTRRQRIINHLLEYISQAQDEDLKTIHPYRLAEYWGEKKYSVLNVFLNAAKLRLLDFRWDVFCPNCKNTKHSFRRMRDIHSDLHCDACDSSYSIDFNENLHLVFNPNPLIRKISNNTYCYGGPQNTPQRVTQHYLKPGQQKYLNVSLEEGTYLFKTSVNDGYLKLHLRKDIDDAATIFITDEDFDGQEATVSINPNLTIVNDSEENLICYIEKENWRREAIYATEVTSSHDFRTLFAQETLKDGQKVTASNVTILFTDLMNSTDLYLQEGDDFAIGQLMSHFKIIQQIVAEERGGIVKTIGDSVMAVFKEPVSALKAVERIQQIFSSSTAMGESFKLKAGIHLGNCTAVNLNDRIDYFGTTVNIASRLVDVAEEKEIVVSEPFYNFGDADLYLENNRKTLFIKTGEKELKGFAKETFKVKQISMERTSMRLVI
ncbi:MAG: adenylate/guanylate cyclase domain-containing protein [Balneola sp.]|nr:adenylate/guanylate cyclase domain-containing protein [Balneola sp.]MBO6649419.1 adenylate/guanylate cyclase domain-containing protein [Balneola sp.]MBO6711234.1 adenylate/guanylate cyclase domain-containing protein [Balneola sp.]MBO6800651.1 adenylate/guanylate cyclase domain-containing protein [Balneola sp.]MBO6869170.1 adenylate/guanylate cyclase domain-containing protein [Balneola sp.]